MAKKIANSKLLKEIKDYMKDLKSKDIASLPEEDKVALIEKGLEIASKSAAVQQKRTMQDIMNEQAAKVIIGGVDIPSPVNSISNADLELINGMIESRKASDEAFVKGLGTVLTLLVSASMLAA